MNAIVHAEPVANAPADSRALMTLIERAATSPDFDMDKLQKLLDLKERWDANEARKAYTSAMAAFKANAPEIVKDKHVKFQTSKGVTEYDHETLGNVCKEVIKGLAQHGISHRWELAQNDARVKVTCILTHAQGHSESTSLHSAPDDSGGKNSIQAIGSVVKYLERYTLLAATGLAPMDAEDDDGRDSGPKAETITEKQTADLKALITEGGGDMAKALRFLRINSLAEIPAKNFEPVVAQIKSVNAARDREDRARRGAK
jgi:hypothetical protein